MMQMDAVQIKERFHAAKLTTTAAVIIIGSGREQRLRRNSRLMPGSVRETAGREGIKQGTGVFRPLRHFYAMRQPPSTGIVAPVTYEASDEARNTATAATSAG